MTETPNRSGYWMVGSDGRVYNFGEAKTFGDATLAAGAQAVDLEPTPSGNGYWIVDDLGHVFAKGDAKALGDVSRSILNPAEVDHQPVGDEDRQRLLGLHQPRPDHPLRRRRLLRRHEHR